MPDSYSSSSYYYSSSTNTADGSNTSGHRYTTTSHTDPEGYTIVRTAHQDLGEPTIVEERRYDRSGQEQPLLSQSGERQRITEIGDSGDPLGSEPDDPEVSYGGPQHGAAEGEGQGIRTFGYDGSADRVTYASDPSYGLWSFNRDAGVFNEAVARSLYGAPGRSVGWPGYAASSGYTDFDRKMREYEDPSTGARIRRESDVDFSSIS